jgi:hypothetical protein
MSTEEQAIELRLANLEDRCTSSRGASWGEATFADIEIDDLVHIGYVCITKAGSDGYREWRYYDSEGIYNHLCLGDSEVQVCE